MTYLNKREAAARAGVSPRRILELASDKILRSKMVKDPRSHQMAVVVHEGDLDKYIDTFRTPAVEVMARPSPSGTDDLAEKLALLKAALAPPVLKLWLTLKEAEDHAGLPTSVLEMLIESGELPAFNVGVRKGGRWRVRRSDLDAIAGVTQVRALGAGRR